VHADSTRILGTECGNRSEILEMLSQFFGTFFIFCSNVCMVATMIIARNLCFVSLGEGTIMASVFYCRVIFSYNVVFIPVTQYQ
jgi:hypothetical protein